MSLQQTEAECAANATAPRVSLTDIEAAIAHRFEFTGADVLNAIHWVDEKQPDAPSLSVLSICLLVMKNGFTVIGKSAPASPENFNADLGQKLAYEDGIRQLWPLMGFSLRDRLAHAQRPKPTIAELERILAEEPGKIDILPDGSVKHTPGAAA